MSDRANNSRFARTLVLYDPGSQVEINNSSEARIFASSGSPEVDFQWQTNLTSPIVISWKNHFRNRLHEDNRLLSRVLPFAPKHFIERVGDRDIVDDKSVTDEYDDHDGERKVDAIPNVHGMVRFEVAYTTDRLLGASCEQPPNTWTEVSNPLSEEYSFNENLQDGDTVCIWIRGSDILDNSQTDMTTVNFDSTEPKLEALELERNVAPEGEVYFSR